MGISVFPAPPTKLAPDNWQLLQTLSPSSTSTISTSVSLTSYYTLMLISSVTTTTDDTERIQFNNDTGNNYSGSVVYGTNVREGVSSIAIRAQATTGLHNSNAVISYANISAPKLVQIYTDRGIGSGSWHTASPITSITFFTSGATNFSGTIKIYGIAG